jgi:hypothetical protein
MEFFRPTPKFEINKIFLLLCETMDKKEAVAYVALIAFLQIRIFLHGLSFSEKAAQVVQLPGLRQGWLGHTVDLSDSQWRDFRSSLPLLSLAFSIFLLLSRFIFPVVLKSHHQLCAISNLLLSLLFIGEQNTTHTTLFRYLESLFRLHCLLLLLLRLHCLS